MGKHTLKISIIVLSLLVASISTAEELLQNGGFEAGDLFPWEEVGDRNAWSVSEGNAYDGGFSALVRGPHRLAQSFDPTPGLNIEVFSMAVMTGVPGWITVEIAYDDDLEPTLARLYVPAALQWQALDLLEFIDPDREVYQVALAGHQNGDSPDDMRTWYDAITLQGTGPDDDPDDPVEDPEASETLEASVKRVRVKFNTKRSVTHVSLALRAEDLPEGIEEGPVEITVLFSQDGFTTAFEAEAELVDVPHRRDHIIRLMDEGSAQKVKCKK